MYKSRASLATEDNQESFPDVTELKIFGRAISIYCSLNKRIRVRVQGVVIPIVRVA